MKKLWIMFLAAVLTAVFAASAMAGGITSHPADYVYDASIDLALSEEGGSEISCSHGQYSSENIADEDKGGFYSVLKVPSGYTGGKVLSVFTVADVSSPDIVKAVYYKDLPAAIGDKAADLYLYFTTEDTAGLSTVAVMPLKSYYHSDTKKLAITSLPSEVTSAFWKAESVLSVRLVIVQATGSGAPVVDVTGVTLNKRVLTLVKGNSKTLTATVAPANATDKSVTWESGSADVVSVDKNGKVTALKAGWGKEYYITVTTTDKEKTDVCKVIVTEPAASEDIHEADPKYADSAMSADIAAIVSADLAVEDGKLVLTKTVQDKAFDIVVALDAALKGGTLKIFPIISNDVKSGDIAAVKYTVKGDLFGVSAVTDMKVYKVLEDGNTIPFAVITSEDQRGDMTAALYKSGDIVTGSIDKTAEYTLITYVKDGGFFDLDWEANGTVVDPVGVGSPAEASPVKSGSSSGCSAGFGAMALLALAALPFLKRKK